MSSSLRTWIAGLLLAASAIALTAGASPAALGTRAALVALIVFAQAWIVAVGERACVHHGGMRLPRFPIAPRLVGFTPGAFPQWLVMVALLGLATGSWTVAGVALGVVIVLTVELLRRLSPLVLTVGAGLHALATMREFHTLGDLLDTMKGWAVSLVWLVLIAALLSGPLLRTDVSRGYKRIGLPLAAIAGVFAWVGGAWLAFGTNLFTLPRLAPFGHDLYALAMGILLGGTAQSLVIGLAAKQVDLLERDPLAVPLVSAHRIGQALMPMLMIVVALILPFHFPLGSAAEAAARPGTWTAVITLALLVPLVPGAVLVAASLDRVDTTSLGRLHTQAALVALAGWFVIGPDALRFAYGPDGPLTALRGLLGRGETLAPFASPDTSQTRLVLFGLPAADLCRAATLMVAACACLSARLVRRSPDGGRAPGWVLLFALAAAQVGGSWWLMPRLGAVGAPLAAALAGAGGWAWAQLARLREGVEPEPKGTGHDLLAARAAALAHERADQELLAKHSVS